MNYQDFITKVSQRSGLDYDQAEQATHSFLETLGVYLNIPNAEDVGNHLPVELRETIIDTAGVNPSAEADGFYEYIGHNSVIGHHYSTAVWATLKEVLPATLIERIQDQLPATVVRTL